MSQPVRIASVQFSQFKALARYSISLERLNILVGPNNSGKSTVIGAFRALAQGLRVANSKSPTRVDLSSGHRIGYRLNESTLPISLENVHTDYSSTDSSVTFSLSNRNRLHLVFPRDQGCFLIPEVPGETIRTVGHFKKQFPLSLTVVPVLGPVEHREQRREKDTVLGGLSTHRAARHFRSYWHYFGETFDEFAELLKRTWPGMEIQRPEVTDVMTGELAMFCLEGRMTRELYWAGFGFQVWCQLLTHISRAHTSSLVVIDEPEVYLHPDVQRQLLGILRELGPDVLVATHSTEIMSEADPTEIISVDKTKTSADRLKNVDGVQRALESVGSIQNITLTALARHRRVLFVEGDDDYRMLRRFARRLGMLELASGVGITSLESGGFGSWQRITTLAEGIERALGASLMIGAVYDRDYFCPEEIQHVMHELSRCLTFAHVHQRKEIENYLLVPPALDRAIAKAVSDRASRTGAGVRELPSAEALLREITDPWRDDVLAQFIARRTSYLRASGTDLANLARDVLAWFAPRWTDLPSRLSLVSGKETLRAFRERLHGLAGVTLTDARIIDSIHREEIHEDLVGLIRRIEVFRKV
jgi:hypothetical protein